MNTLKKILSKLVGNANILSNNVLLIDFTGSHEKGQFLSQLFYWSSRTKMEDGFFAKSYTDWFEEVRIKEHSIRRFAKEFKEAGWLETKVKKFKNVPTLHYKLDQDKLISALVTFCDHDNLRPSHGARVEPDNLQGSREPDNLQGSINIDLHRLQTESEGAPAHEEEDQKSDPPKQQKNEPPKVAPKGSAPDEPVKLPDELAFDYLLEYFQKNSHFLDAIKSDSGYNGKIAGVLKDYLNDKQEKGEWHFLTIKDADHQQHWHWIGQVKSGVTRWAKARARNERKKQELSETPKYGAVIQAA